MKPIGFVIIWSLATAASPVKGRAQASEFVSEYENVFAEPEPDSFSGALSPLLQPPVPAWHAMVTNIPGDWVRSGQSLFRMESIPAIAAVVLSTGILFAVVLFLFVFFCIDVNLHRIHSKHLT